MSLRTAALEALQNRKDEEAAAARALAESTARAGVKRIAKSPLGKWFPQIEWEFVANLADGATVVRERGGDDLLLGAKITKDAAPEQGPDEWEVAVYTYVGNLPVLGTGQYRRSRVLKTAADLGAYIDETEPKEQPRSCAEADCDGSC